MPELVFEPTPSMEEPLGFEVVKSWNGVSYHGICLETFTDSENSDVSRTLWNDGEIHDLNLATVHDAVALAKEQDHPKVHLKLYDESVYDVFLKPQISTNAAGTLVLRYKNRPDAGSVDLSTYMISYVENSGYQHEPSVDSIAQRLHGTLDTLKNITSIEELESKLSEYLEDDSNNGVTE